MPATRRLAAILAADVVGYSRLIGADEGGTFRRLAAIRAELTDPSIAEHHGRIIKTMGDGLLVEFASVVDALRCAAEVQTAMSERNGAIEVDDRIEFRIGVIVGDVIVENGDIFGDGVNIRSARDRRKAPRDHPSGRAEQCTVLQPPRTASSFCPACAWRRVRLCDGIRLRRGLEDPHVHRRCTGPYLGCRYTAAAVA